MTKAILIASLLGLLTTSALAGEPSFYTQLEQGVRAEAHNQLQGAIGSKLNGSLPASANRVLKPAADALVKDSVDAGANKVKTVSAQPKPVQPTAKRDLVVEASSPAESREAKSDIIIVSKEIQNCKEGAEYLACVKRVQDSSRVQAVTASRNGDKARMQAIVGANSGEGGVTAEQEEKIAKAKADLVQLHQDMADGKVPFPRMTNEHEGSVSAELPPSDVDLYTIPSLPQGSTIIPYCGRNLSTGCIKGLEGLQAMFPDQRQRAKYRAAYQSMSAELQLWVANFYSSETGKVSFPADKKEALAALHETVKRNNQAVRDGYLHPMDLTMRDCIKKQILPDPTATKATACRAGAP